MRAPALRSQYDSWGPRPSHSIVSKPAGITIRIPNRSIRGIEFRSGNGSNPPLYEVGEKVPVLYLPGRPGAAVIDTFIELWLGPVIYTGLGLLLLGFHGFAWLRSKR